jgi:hypothetical protein
MFILKCDFPVSLPFSITDLVKDAKVHCDVYYILAVGNTV